MIEIKTMWRQSVKLKTKDAKLSFSASHKSKITSIKLALSPPLKPAPINNFPAVLHGGTAEKKRAKSALYVQAGALCLKKCGIYSRAKKKKKKLKNQACLTDIELQLDEWAQILIAKTFSLSPASQTLHFFFFPPHTALNMKSDLRWRKGESFTFPLPLFLSAVSSEVKWEGGPDQSG